MQALLRRLDTTPEDPALIRELRGLVAAEYDTDAVFDVDAGLVTNMARWAVTFDRFEKTMHRAIDHVAAREQAAASA